MTSLLRPIVALALMAPALPAQGLYNIDFGDNQVSFINLSTGPGLLIYNLMPRNSPGSAPHHLADVYRPGNGRIPIRLRIHDLMLFEPEACAWGQPVRLTGINEQDWLGTLVAPGFTVHSALDRTLEWTEPGPGINAIPRGVLVYSPTGAEPWGGCAPDLEPLSPAFAAICSWEIQPSESLVQFSGFETGDFGEFAVRNGNVAVQSAIVHSGRFALQATGSDYAYVSIMRETDLGLNSASLGLIDSYATFWFRFAAANLRIRIAEMGGPMGTPGKARLELEADHRLSFEDHNHGRWSGTTALRPDTWYQIRWHAGTGPVARAEVYVDNTLEILTNLANLGSEPTRTFSVGLVARDGGTGDVFCDDVVLSGSEFVEHAAVEMLRPSRSGSHPAWSGTFADVDDWPHDGDGTFCESNGIGEETFALDIAPITGRVAGVKAHAALRRADPAVSAPCSLRLRAGNVDSDTISSDGGPSYRIKSRLFVLDPATGFEWTLLGLAGLEIGAVNWSSARNTRMTAAGVSVLFVPAVGH